MTTTVSVKAEDNGAFVVDVDGEPITTALDDFQQALKITALVVTAELGDGPEAAAAAAELERLGVEPPAIEPDATPLPDGV